MEFPLGSTIPPLDAARAVSVSRSHDIRLHGPAWAVARARCRRARIAADPDAPAFGTGAPRQGFGAVPVLPDSILPGSVLRALSSRFPARASIFFS